MPYLLDAYNLLHAARAMGGPTSSLSVRQMCQYLLAALPSLGKVTLVLDGRAKPDEPSANEFPELSIVYSGAGVKADLVIGQMVERSPAKRKLTVVTNDRAVALHARANLASAMGCETFLKTLLTHTPKAGKANAAEPAIKTSGTPTTGERDLWMEEFGLTGQAGEDTLRRGRAGLEDKTKPSEEIRPEDLDMDSLLGPKE